LGKTRLAEEFLRRSTDAGCRVHRGYCESSLGTKPLQPFIQILRAMFGVATDAPVSTAASQVESGLAAISPELTRLAAPLLSAMAIDDPRVDAGRRRRVGADAVPAALSDLFAALACRQPQVLFIDDLHWADDATHRALDSIRLAGRAILILVANRVPEVGDATPQRAETLELQPLSDADSMQHICQLMPGGNPFLVDQIRQHAGGSPLFIEELCHCAIDDVEVLHTGRLQRGAAWLNVLIQSRVNRLPEAQAALVRSASIIGNVIPAWLLERITGHEIDHPAVRQLAQLDLVFPGEQPGTLRFKHGIARDAIYESVGLHQRKALHLRIAETLLRRNSIAPGEDHCEALAYHFDAGGLPDRAARYAEEAGDKAMAASALDRAQAQYRAALAALDRSEITEQLTSRWNAISQRLGLACVFNPSRSDLPLFQRALALAEASGDIATIAQATYWLGYLQYALGDARQAVKRSEQALLAAGQAGNDRLAVQVRATLGQAMAAAAQYGPALTLLDEAIAIKRAHRSGAGQAVGLAYSLATRGAVLGDRGNFTEAMACFDEALEVVQGARHEMHASIHGLRAAVLLWQGRWEAAHASATEAFRIGERVRSIFTLSMGRAAAAYAEWMLEGKPEALDALQHATRWLEPRGITLFGSFNQGWLADGFATCGNRREARAHAAQALRRWREHDLLGGAMACRAMARLAAQEDDPSRAEMWLARAREIARSRESAHEEAVNTLCEGEIALEQGKAERAGALLDTALQAFAALGMSWHQGRATRLRQRLARESTTLDLLGVSR
jgi:tetratricopeptide (TPR) repeat protein